MNDSSPDRLPLLRAVMEDQLDLHRAALRSIPLVFDDQAYTDWRHRVARTKAAYDHAAAAFNAEADRQSRLPLWSRF